MLTISSAAILLAALSALAGLFCLIQRRNKKRLPPLEAMMDDWPAILWTAWPDGFVNYCNSHWREFTGLNSEEILGFGWMQALHPDDVENTRQAWQQACNQGMSYEVEQRLRRYDGQYGWFLTRATPHKDPDGQVLKWFGINTDITERKRMRELLARQQNEASFAAHQEVLKTVFDHLPAGILLAKGKELVVELVNPAYQAIAPGKAMVGRPMAEIWPETWHQFEQRFYSVLEHGHTVTQIDELFPIRRSPELPLEEAYFTWSLNRVRLMDGSYGVLNTVIETTDRKKTEQQLQESSRSLEAQKAQLVEINQELEAFCYSISHDLRAPLRALNGFAHLLRERSGQKLDAEEQRWLEIIQKEASRMGQLIDDLLRFSRTSRQLMSYTRVDMTALARESYAQCASEEPGRRVELSLGALPSALGDEPLLRAVWVNLLSNAFKFTRPRSDARIEIGGHLEGNQCLFYIRDNGVGFDMRHVGRLFEVFQRLHNQQEFEGLGVGLALVQRIIQRHGGRIWAEGKPGSGATFFFTLPCAQSAPVFP